MISGRGCHCKRSSSASTRSWRKPSANTMSSTPALRSMRKWRSSRLIPPNCSRHLGNCLSSACCKRKPRPAARMMARMKFPSMVGGREFYTAAPPVREQRCRYNRPGTPNSSSRARFANDNARAASGGRPASGASSRYPPSCTPSAPGMAKAAPRIACPRLSNSRASYPTHRVMDQQQNQIYLTGADQPADEGEQETRRHRSPAAVGDLDGTVDCRRVAHPLRPVALAGKSLRGAHQLAEQTTPLHPIKSPHLHRQQAAGDQRRDPQRLLGQMACLRPQQRDTEQRKGNLREGLQRGAHRDRGRGLRQRQAALRQVPGHQQRSAQLSGRHEAVGRLARPPRQQRLAHRTGGRAARLEQHPNGHRIERQRQ